jgi:hypothetical protein
MAKKNKPPDPLSAYLAAGHIHGMAGGIAAISRFLADVHAGNGTNIGSSATEEQAAWLGDILSDWLEATAREIEALGGKLEQHHRPTPEQIGATDTIAPLRIAPAAKAARKEGE